MLSKLTVRNFKSLREVTVELPRLAVLFGPNAVGKSNLLDAIQALSLMGTARTLFDALGGVRGHAVRGILLRFRRIAGVWYGGGSASFTLGSGSVSRKGKLPLSDRTGVRFQVGPAYRCR